MSTPAPPLLTTVNSQVFLQMVFIFEGLATLSAFELAIACSLGQHLVLGGKEEKKKRYQHEFYARETMNFKLKKQKLN